MTLKNLHSLFVAVLVCMLASCSSDDVLVTGEEKYIGTTGTITPVEFDDTRSSLVFSSTGMTFSWEEGDSIRIYPKYVGGTQTFGSAEAAPSVGLTLIPGSLTGFESGKITGHFGVDGKRYILNMEGTSDYLTIYPDKKNLPVLGYTEIPIDYTGQKQKSNVKIGYYNTGDPENDALYMASEREASSHLGDYDYMYGNATQREDGSTHFVFKHLQATVRFYMEVPQPEVTQVFDSIMILHNFETSAEARKFTTNGTLNLETEDFTWGEQPRTLTLKFGDEGFDLRDYNESTGEYSAGYSDDYKRNGKYYIIAYMEMFPVELILDNILKPTLYLLGHKMVNGEKVRTFYKAMLTKRNLLAGKAYQWTTTPDEEEPITFEVLSVQQWEEETGFTNGDKGNGTQDW